VNEWVRNSPPETGGVDATSRRSSETSFNGADGVVKNGTIFKNAFRNISAIPTTPSAPLWWLRIFFLMAQPPYIRRGVASLTFIHKLEFLAFFSF
jgi:hypothetical protein